VHLRSTLHLVRSLGVTRIVLVEDDPRISEPLVRMLQAEGFTVEHHDSGLLAVEAILGDRPDLVLLDLSLPDIDGLEVCRRVRAAAVALPIVMLTARAEEADIVVGLSAGADDYIAKPFRLAELLARVHARLRSAEATTTTAPSPTDDIVELGVLRLDLAARRSFLRSEEIDLTAKELDLLALLMRNVGRTVRREDIMAAVWDENWWGSTRTLDTHVSTLRRKIGDLSDPPTMVVTVRGIGFRFEG
jgi:DNA-binding response OmpR family regulator